MVSRLTTCYSPLGVEAVDNTAHLPLEIALQSLMLELLQLVVHLPGEMRSRIQLGDLGRLRFLAFRRHEWLRLQPCYRVTVGVRVRIRVRVRVRVRVSNVFEGRRPPPANQAAEWRTCAWCCRGGARRR